jgi:excisionase family DNA binding protein
MPVIDRCLGHGWVTAPRPIEVEWLARSRTFPGTCCVIGPANAHLRGMDAKGRSLSGTNGRTDRALGPAKTGDVVPLPRLLDIDGVAEVLGVTVRHVRRLVAERRIPFLKWGHLIRFDPADIAGWLENARVGQSSPVGVPFRR